MPHLVTSTRQHGYDDIMVGEVVGGDVVPWAVFYDGRPQSQKAYATNDDEAIAMGRAIVAELQAKYRGEPCHLYKDAAKWEIRIYED